MDVKEYLSKIGNLDRKINNKINELDEYRQSAYGISIVSDGERVKTSLDPDKMSAVVDKIILLENEIDRLTDEYADLKEEAYKVSENMNTIEYAELINMVYLYDSRMSLYAYSRKKHKDYANVKKTHKKALEEFEKTLDVVVGLK